MTSYPLILSSITPREAIADALLRCFIGIDHNDAAVFKSAFAGEDIYLSHSSMPKPFTSLSALTAGMFTRVGPLDTTHMLSNVRIDYEKDEDTANMTAYALCQHAPPGQGKQPDGPKYTTGVAYTVGVVRNKEDGLWKISKAVLEVVWTQGDQTIMGGPPPAT
ncbi:NTF2-like protein [Glarea lozoyensis ATCC 20868]|uniref:NTF2-like protein n=1 Tax=Glarea lozoyensis (strain ATCC 20868 / MF5171) TaxID=1116229 RepID=S3DSW2_GLAL2|nr:NTF2-like protein [Glarea lozoyensis ATCC 20868]EPE35066.1 NTF2-like protein [Glarea lozoyensis ATCC 20868]